MRLKTYDGTFIISDGEIHFDLKFNNITAKQCRLIVIKNGSATLMR